MPSKTCVSLTLAMVLMMAPAARATVSVTATADAYAHGNGQLLDEKHGSSDLQASASASGVLLVDPGAPTGHGPGPGIAGANITAATFNNSIKGAAGAENYQYGGGLSTAGPTEGLGYGTLAYNFFNDGAAPVHAYLDFSLSNIFIQIGNGRLAGDPGQDFAAAFISAAAELNGHSIFNDDLFSARAGNSAAGSSFTQQFNALLTDTDTTIGCFNGAFDLCRGDIKGTLDLGLVGIGDTLSLDYLLGLQAYVDPNHLTLAGSTASISVNDSGCDGPCPVAALRFDTAAIPAVPEPASWAFMIVGLGLVGGALRRPDRRLCPA